MSHYGCSCHNDAAGGAAVVRTPCLPVVLLEVMSI